ncbi:MAG: FecR domain-containing protein [Bacteroidota bacterium]|nr:FecR domain-containing protein [Bacteroidota bacterium]
MKDKDKDNLIAKWVTGEISSSEKGMVEQLLNSDQEFANELKLAQQIWNDSLNLKETPLIDEDEAWTKVSVRMKKSGRIIPLFSSKGMFSIAASLLLVMVATVMYFILKKNNYQSIEQQAVVVSSTSSGDVVISKKLADGSSVTINKGSKLIYPDSFKSNERRVKLEGEAFFDITKDPYKPFVIEAGPLASIQVLGTSFNVRELENGNVEVKVSTGKVKLYTSESEIFIIPGEMGVFDKQSNQITKLLNNDPNYEFWRTKTLVFNNTELSKVVEVLSKYYEYEIVIGSAKLNELRLTATFKNESLEQVLELIKESLEIDIVKSGNKYIFIEK